MSRCVRRSHAGELRFDHPAGRVFAALCPVAEKLPGDLVYSESGAAEPALVYRTPGRDGAAETIYTYAVHDPAAGRVVIVGVRADDRVTTMDIEVTADGPNASRASVRITRTGLSTHGNEAVGRITSADFEAELQRWETDIAERLDRG